MTLSELYLGELERDAWQMPPNAPPLVGREVIRAFWKNALNWGSWKFEFQTLDVAVNGPLAVERGKYRLRFTAKPGVTDGMPSLEDRGNYVVLWRLARTTESGGPSGTLQSVRRRWL